MNSDKPKRVRQILEMALSLPPAERAGRLAEACAGDTDLRQEIEGLLDLYAHSPHEAPDQSPPSSPTTFSPDSFPDLAVTSPSPGVRATPGGTGAATSWGGFVLLEELGRGGFGVVHRAWDATLKRDVALKIIDARRLHGVSEDAVLREGQLMARIRHPNVVTVYSAQRIGPEVGLTMEYIKGRTLSMLVAEDGPLGAHEAALIGMSLCDALTAVHRLGLVHRDLKASNVMREHGGRIVLMDFGAGRELGTSDGRVHVLGTPVYMAPEVLLGGRGSPASDLYSLGVLLYNLVTADYPVRGARMDQIRVAHLAGDRVPLAERRSELPAPFVGAVERALSSEPGDRPTTAVAFKRLLSDAMPYLPPDSAGRKRRRAGPATPKPAPATPTLHPVSTPAWRSSPLALTMVSLTVLVLLATALGFVTTIEFNSALGRTGEFSSEGLLAYPMLGARSVFASVVYILLAFLVLNVLAAIVRGAGHLVPAIGRLTSTLGARLARAVARTGLHSPTALSQALPVAGLAGLALVVWYFRPFLQALFGDVNETQAGALALLGSGNEHMQLVFRRSLEVVLVLLTAGLVYVLRQRRRGGTVSPAAVAATSAVIVMSLVLLVLPWRLVFHAEFQEVALDGRPCFLIGESSAQLLVHCPGDPPSRRNTVVPKGDPRLRLSGRISNLFDAYNPPGAVAR